MAENKYTKKSIEAINGAQALASERGNQELVQAHLLAALLEDENGLIPQLLKKMGKDAAGLSSRALALVDQCPKVQGLSREQGKVYISQDMDKAISEAAKVAAVAERARTGSVQPSGRKAESSVQPGVAPIMRRSRSSASSIV